VFKTAGSLAWGVIMKFSALLGILAVSVLATSNVLGQTMIEGVYMSSAGENGRGGCTLEVKSLGKSPRHGDDMYSLISTGEGACEWTAIGLARNFAITAGMLNSGGHSGYVNARWPFGPSGAQVEIASFDTDGAPRTKITFSRSK
jgi:hypothetical protein